MAPKQITLYVYPATIWLGHVSDSSQVNSIINIANSYMLIMTVKKGYLMKN